MAPPAAAAAAAANGGGGGGGGSGGGGEGGGLPLPVALAADALVAAVRATDKLVVVGETGSGKTTLLPQLILDRVLGGGAPSGGVVVAQPRRVAATSVARRVAAERGVPLGGEVGYAVRFDEKADARVTRLKYVTDGLLVREALLDGTLARYAVAVVDEAHERSVHTDVLLGVLVRAQRARRAAHDAAAARAAAGDARALDGVPPPLKLLVMSATLDADAFLDFLGDGADAVYVAGRSHPVEVLYTRSPEPDVLEAALLAVVQVHLDERPGGVLVFLTGQEEIESAESLLKERARLLPAAAGPLQVLPLFAAQTADLQERVFAPVPEGHRRVILATTIAETSLTLPGVRYVVDTGLCKARAFNARTGVDALVVTPVSKAAARQRAGRAGREAPGKCFRLYTERAFDQLKATAPPEILRCHLASIVLQLKAMGIKDVAGFEFMAAPPRSALLRALEQLYALGALDDNGELTRPLGEQMAALPLEPMAAKMVLRSGAHGCAREALALAGMMSVDAIFVSPRAKHEQAAAARRKLGASQGDHLTLLNVFRAFREVSDKGEAAWCRERFVSRRALLKAFSVANQLVRYGEGAGIDTESSCGNNLEPLRRCLAEGFFLHAARAMPDGSYKCLASGQVVSVHPSSVLGGAQRARHPCVVYSELVRTTKVWMRDVTAIEPRWLAELAPRFYASAPAAGVHED
eukprot:PRCOL_00006108-RA